MGLLVLEARGAPLLLPCPSPWLETAAGSLFGLVGCGPRLLVDATCARARAQLPTLAFKLKAGETLNVVVLYGTREACAVDEVQAAYTYFDSSHGPKKKRKEDGVEWDDYPLPKRDDSTRIQCGMSCPEFVNYARGKYPCKDPSRTEVKEDELCIPSGGRVPSGAVVSSLPRVASPRAHVHAAPWRVACGS